MLLRFLAVILLSLLSVESIANGGVTCADWMGGANNPGVNISEMGNGMGKAIMLRRDLSTQTVSQACRDAMDPGRYVKGFPVPVFPRQKLVRSGTPFNPTYRVHRQACLMRDCLCNKCECSMNIFDWTNFKCGPRNKDMWVLETVEDPAKQSASVCMEKYPPGSELMYSPGTYNNTSLTSVCAYASLKNIYGSCISVGLASLIGCVDEPPKPAPPIYNPVIVTQANPMVVDVDTYNFINSSAITDILPYYIGQGSTFDKPIIQMAIKNQASGLTTYLNLQYNFSSNLNTTAPAIPACDTFPTNVFKPAGGGTYTFCAQVPSANPSQVCACMKTNRNDLCAAETYMGCVPRPTLQQSGYVMVVDNVRGTSDYTNYNYKTATYIPSAQITFVKTDSVGPIIFDKTGARISKNLADRKYYQLNSNNSLNLSAPAQYPWSTLTDYYNSGSYTITAPADTATASALSAQSKVANTNFLPQPPVGIASIDSSGNTKYDQMNSIFEYRPTYDLSPQTANPPTYGINGYNQDVMNVYGINFAAVMPKMDPTTNRPLQVSLVTPANRQHIDQCNAYSTYSSLSNQSMFANAQTSYYVPDGTRWRGACNGKPGCSVGPLVNGSGQDCIQATSDFTFNGITVSAGNYFECNTGTPNCCLGMISNNFNFVPPSGNNLCQKPAVPCTSVISHDAYAEGLACPGAYATEIGDFTGNPAAATPPAAPPLPPTYKGPVPSDLSLFVYSSAPNGANISGPQKTVATPATPFSAAGTAPDIDPATGAVQASNICVYSPDSIIDPDTGNPWNPIGYDLNTADPAGLNAYLCDHIPQMCNNVITGAANTGWATWPRTLPNIDGTAATSSGACVLGYSNDAGVPPTATCNEGWLMSDKITYAQIPGSNDMSVNNKCLKNCATTGAITMDTANKNYNQSTSGKPGIITVNGVDTVANGPVVGNCAPGFFTSTGGSTFTATCNNGNYINTSDTCTQATSCPATTVNGAVFNSTQVSNSATGTCASGYYKNNNVAPTGICNANGTWGTINNTCVPGCQAFTVPTGTSFSDTSAKPWNTVVKGECDNAKGYFGSCEAPGAYMVTCSSTNSAPIVIATCGADGNWSVTGNTCDNNKCFGWDGSTIDKMPDKTDSGSSYTLDCDKRHKNPPILYCRNGAWSSNKGSFNNGKDICDKK